MARKTMAHGFVSDLKEIIYELEKRDVIDIKCWVAYDLPADDKYMYNLFDFREDNFVEIYSKKYHYYTDDLVINDEIYAEIYKSLPVFLDQCTRNKLKEPLHNYYELLNYFNLLVRLFYGICKKEKIDLFLCPCIPHMSDCYIMYIVAKALGIDIIILRQTIFPDRCVCLDTIEDLSLYSYMQESPVDEVFSLKDYDDGIKKYYDVLLKVNEPQPTIKELIYQTYLRLQHKNTIPPRRILYDLIANYRKKSRKVAEKIIPDCYTILNVISYDPYWQIRRKVDSIAEKVDIEKKYVYFPLHMQPEMTTSSLGGIYSDQLLAIEKVAELIPHDWTIYVKEHFRQTSYRRDESFFMRLKHIKKAKVVSWSENSQNLIANAQFVATITGTAGWEAIQRGIPVLTFGHAWYNPFEGVFNYSKDFKFSNIHNYKINLKTLESDINKLLKKTTLGTVGVTFKNLKKYDKIENTKLIVDYIEKRLTESMTP